MVLICTPRPTVDQKDLQSDAPVDLPGSLASCRRVRHPTSPDENLKVGGSLSKGGKNIKLSLGGKVPRSVDPEVLDWSFPIRGRTSSVLSVVESLIVPGLVPPVPGSEYVSPSPSTTGPGSWSVSAESLHVQPSLMSHCRLPRLHTRPVIGAGSMETGISGPDLLRPSFTPSSTPGTLEGS